MTRTDLRVQKSAGQMTMIETGATHFLFIADSSLYQFKLRGPGVQRNIPMSASKQITSDLSTNGTISGTYRERECVCV